MADRVITNHCGECSMRNIHLEALSEDELDVIDQHRTELSYSKGESLCKQGAFLSNIIFIRSGLVKVCINNNEDSTILFLGKAGSFIGLPSLYGEEILHYSAQALTETKACLINVVAFKDTLSENSAFASDVIKIINKDMVAAFERISSISTKQLHGRLAELLLHLEKDIYKKNPFILTLTKSDLADILATSKESVSRLFSEFKRDGIIEEYRHQIEILDHEKLDRISRTG
jgi:CRP-like cAMP-binding protein